MATIELTEFEGTRALLVRCFEPYTKFYASEPPYEREVLKNAVAVCPNASIRQVGYEYIPSPADTGDERFDFLLEPTRPNVLALRATRFPWSSAAIDLVTGIEISDEVAREVEERANDRLQRQQQENIVKLERMLEEIELIKQRQRRREQTALERTPAVAHTPLSRSMEIGQTIVEKDYAKQRSGRWKRGLVGSVACMLLMGFLFGAAALSEPTPPKPGFMPWLFALFGIAGVAGGIAGALTDSR
jgi:hypothetical protein